MQQLVTPRFELRGCYRYRVNIGNLELDAHLGHRRGGRPLRSAEARLRSLRQRPDAEVLGAAYLLAGEIVAVELFEGEPERVDVELAAGGGIGRDHTDAGDELDAHTQIIAQVVKDSP